MSFIVHQLIIGHDVSPVDIKEDILDNMQVGETVMKRCPLEKNQKCGYLGRVEEIRKTGELIMDLRFVCHPKVLGSRGENWLTYLLGNSRLLAFKLI